MAPEAYPSDTVSRAPAQRHYTSAPPVLYDAAKDPAMIRIRPEMAEEMSSPDRPARLARIRAENAVKLAVIREQNAAENQ